MSEVIQIINAVAVVVLVMVTWYYAWTTKQILDESEKLRRAAERQASSAESQADAAHATLNHLRQQVEDFAGLGSSIVQTNIDTAVRSIERWKQLDIKKNIATAQFFPSPTDLVPENAQNTLEHARRISVKCANLLTEAFDELRSARAQIEILRHGSDTSSRAFSYFDSSKYDPDQFLTAAFSKLQEARKFVS